MKTLKNYGTAVCLMTICLFSAGTLRAEDGEKRVKMGDLPEAVQKTVREQSKGAKVRGLSVEIENRKTCYEAELKVKGRNKDILIDGSGAVLEVEEKVEFASLPAAVKDRLIKSAGKGKVKRVEAISKSGAPVVYEALIKTAGKKSEVTVAADGKLISDETLKNRSEEKEKGEASEKKEGKGEEKED